MGRGIYHSRWELAGRETGRGNLPQEMGHQGHPMETNLRHDMGRPRPELAGRETGRGIYRGRLGIVGNWQVGRWEEEFSTGDGTSKVGTGRQGDRKREFNRRRWDIQGRRIYHMTWDFQGRNWQVGRREEEFTAGGWASWELAGREMGRGI